MSETEAIVQMKRALTALYLEVPASVGNDITRHFDDVLIFIAALEAKLEATEDALRQIVSWANAYPLEVFPEPDFVRAHELLKAGGMTLDVISASNMRHVVEGVGRIAKEAIAATQQEGT